uniref:Uncharacterized protein n=1 Tax=Globodera rostochiensis TaxID=31243 RepID=A0A914HRT5_GLORO
MRLKKKKGQSTKRYIGLTTAIEKTVGRAFGGGGARTLTERIRGDSNDQTGGEATGEREKNEDVGRTIAEDEEDGTKEDSSGTIVKNRGCRSNSKEDFRKWPVGRKGSQSGMEGRRVLALFLLVMIPPIHGHGWVVWAAPSRMSPEAFSSGQRKGTNLHSFGAAMSNSSSRKWPLEG